MHRCSVDMYGLSQSEHLALQCYLWDQTMTVESSFHQLKRNLKALSEWCLCHEFLSRLATTVRMSADVLSNHHLPASSTPAAPSGRPHHTWLQMVKADIAPGSSGLAMSYHRAQNRQAWSAVAGTATSNGQVTVTWWWRTFLTKHPSQYLFCRLHCNVYKSRITY